jgi:protease-4
MLEQVFTDNSVAAVVIRISSGGGSALASDFMQAGLVSLQKKYPKPVVFSFGDVAASGGYYIACAEGEIMANPGTLTGSIGVIAGKLTLEEFYAKIGVSKETIKVNEMDDIFSESRQLTPKEREVIQKDVEFIYDRFTGKVVEFRNIPKEKIPDTAEGRVFTGNQAANNGLVDKLGGFVASVELAAKKAEISDYEIKELPNRKFNLAGLFESEDVIALKESLEPIIKNYELLKLRGERALLLVPYNIEIK